MPTLTAGDVPFILAGERRVLRPTLRAVTHISSVCGGLKKALTAIGEFDLTAMTAVIRAGLNLTDQESKKVPELIYETGILELTGPLSDFIVVLANGGKPIVGAPINGVIEDEHAEGNVIN
jgi:hypothetical protein